MRQPKLYLNKVNISDLNKQKNETTCSMLTPCFVHTINYLTNSFNSKPILLAGIENGLCFACDANSMSIDSFTSEQLQSPFNCALTHLICLNEQQETLVACGNGKSIELFNLSEQENNKIKINKQNEFKINHNAKINSAKCQNNKLFLADTTNHLTIYDFNKQ